ncbi:minor capsid protein [Nocardiopsis sp. CT-R113]|uniref:Minor capsid protein n=1 Tax=Nocardiopsis codii TaxID=3065942 RepID=A0ABU7KGB6_9ACTN|nr:minor capsid protein [Nocardiopsis sp. CT-R113]MEE2041281.1 minor capsid protein [Nocardiopsis sp. CT-R113]
MPLLSGLAAYLALDELALGLSYRPDGSPYGPDEVGIALDVIPAGPDRAVMLTSYNQGPEPDSLQAGADEHRVQIRARGTADPAVSRALLRAIYDVLHGLDGVELPDGTHLVLAVAMQADATAVGIDGNRRHHHVQSYRLIIDAPTAHRQ